MPLTNPISKSECRNSAWPVAAPEKKRAPYVVPKSIPGAPGEVVSLFEAAKRLGLRERSLTNWTPLLVNLCKKGLIDVRYAAGDRVPCVRVADLRHIGALVERHINRPRMWPVKPRKSGRGTPS